MSASQVIDGMFNKDHFSQWLGIKRLEEAEGFCKLQLTIRPEMCNGFGIAHGGITYSLADSALAFASNSYGRQALSIETSISHIKMLVPGDVIIATATEVSKTFKIAIYHVKIETAAGQLAALFKGMVYIKS